MKTSNLSSESGLLPLISLFCALSVSLHSAYAAEQDASLDQMWKDGATQSSTDKANSSPGDATAGARITMPQENTSLDNPQPATDSPKASDSANEAAPETKAETKPEIKSDSSDAAAPKANSREVAPQSREVAPQTSNIELKQPTLEDNVVASPEKTSAGGGGKLCSLDKFIHSAVVLGTGWPGIGQFKAVQPGPNTYVDGARNRLGLSVEQEKIVAAELALASQPNASTNFVSVEMGVDFLLEGLGTKADKINDINLAIEKVPGLVAGKSFQPMELSVDNYLVILDRADDTSDYHIRVKDSSAGNVQVAMADPIPVPEKPAVMPANIRTTPLRPRPSAPKPTPAPPQPAKPADNAASKYEDLLNQLQDDNATSANSPRGIAGAELELKKKVFLETLQKWQRLKKIAVRQREITDLPKALAGKALKRQSDSIKWLAENHKYFETSPKGIVVERVVAVEPEKIYEVYALVKEQNKYVDDTTSQVLKETEEVNNVKYVLELNGDHWLIIDSALLKPANQIQPPPAKPQH